MDLLIKWDGPPLLGGMCLFCCYSIASRIPPGRLISVVCLVACWFVVFASVCMFFRSWNLLALSSGACLGGLLGFILGAWGFAWAPFWGLGAPLGVDFGGLGLPWAQFLGLWDSSGAFGAPWGAPLAAQGAQSQIFPLFSLPFWPHFGSILEVTIDEKSDVVFH